MKPSFGVIVVLHPSPQLASEVKDINKIHHGKRKYLTHHQFEKKYGGSQDDLDKVTNFAYEPLSEYLLVISFNFTSLLLKINQRSISILPYEILALPLAS